MTSHHKDKNTPMTQRDQHNLFLKHCWCTNKIPFDSSVLKASEFQRSPNGERIEVGRGRRSPKNKKSVSHGQIVNVGTSSLPFLHTHTDRHANLLYPCSLCECQVCIALAGSGWPLTFWSACRVFAEELGMCQLGNYFNNSRVWFLYSVEPSQG